MANPAVLLLALPLLVLPQDDPEKDLKSKDFEVRKAAVVALSDGKPADADKLLAKALSDDDWEIVELAAIGLGGIGESAGAAARKKLLEVALEGPVRRVRTEAARALARIDANEAFEELSKKVSGKFAAPASEAIVELGAPADERSAPKSLVKSATKGKEYAERRSAAMALLVMGAKDRAENLTELLEHEELGVHAAALDAVRAVPAQSDLAPVRAFLKRQGLPGVNERRGVWAVRAILWTNPDASAREVTAKEIVAELLGADGDAVQRRAAMLLEALREPPRDTYGRAVHGEERKFDDAWLLEALEPALTHSAAAVRAAAVHALGTLGTDEARARARELGADDRDAHVRRTAVAAVTARRPDAAPKEDADAHRFDDETAAWILARLDAEKDSLTREDLCVAAGTKNFKEAVPALAKALTDSDPWVVVCAAVALGKTRLPDGLVPLKGLLTHADWRIRGAAVVGIGQSWQKDAVPALISVVEDAEPSVARAAHDFLRSYSGRQEIAATKAAWQEWWDAKQEALRLVDPETAEERAKKYGYSTDWDRIYGGLQVVVLDSRGDHIQNILQRFGIQHRLTQAAQIPESELHPQAVYVSNCTGEIEGGDVDHLAWFLRTGGYMFGSCWTLHETVEKVFPGVVRKYETAGEVLDDVSADNCAPGSPYLEGVFSAGVQPVYHLEGAHLIEVLDRERAQVLIDSPDCAERWGAGDLAVWFPAGHGVVLDSVNHFEEQGFKHARGLKKPEELQAYAIDHLGLTYADWRDTRDEKYWKSPSKAAGEVLDLSVFKLITNFVRLKRLQGY